MAIQEYTNALRLGKKKYQDAVGKDEYPYLPVLDEIIENVDIVSEVNLGTLIIPLENVVGTKTKGRTQSFASNFMPLLDEQTEFSTKWSAVYTYQLEQGIDDPIIAYEYMNKFYVLEGNKRVSVLKFLKADSIRAKVIRLVPRRSDNLEVRVYYEFIDFYDLTANYSIRFTEEGKYTELLEAMEVSTDVPLDLDEQKSFRQIYGLFKYVFESLYSTEKKLSIADAFLKYVKLFTYPVIKERTESQIRNDFLKFGTELLLSAKGNQIELVTKPKEKEKEHTGTKLLNWLRPWSKIEPEMLKIAFIYPKTVETSRWTYGHELGRIHLESCFEGKLKTMVFDSADSDEEVKESIEKAIAHNCNVIFAAGPQMATQCVKAAVLHPEVRIFNCSVNMSYSSICNYYPRMFESKFLMGALAAAMSETDKLGYLADYPIYGMIANINAFALGAAMINPRVQIHLKWVGLADANEEIEWDDDIQIISGVDMIIPENASREYGLYRRMPDGEIENLALSFCHWGKFYEKMIQQICSGESRDDKSEKASNYWWGMSADVIDTIYSEDLPNGTYRLVNFLSSSINKGIFHPFAGRIFAQKRRMICDHNEELGLMDIIEMNWLANNIIGEIPPAEAFKEEAQALIRLQGVKTITDDEPSTEESTDKSLEESTDNTNQ